jgi:hypothetical protein
MKNETAVSGDRIAIGIQHRHRYRESRECCEGSINFCDRTGQEIERMNNHRRAPGRV